MSTPEISDEAVGGAMPAADVKFLISCLRNTTQGSISVDLTKIAAECGYTNVRSASNRINALKKKYDLPFGTTTKSTGEASGTAATPKKTPKKASDAAGPTEPKVPITPSKNKVTKTRTPAKPKVTPGKKVKTKTEEDANDELADTSDTLETFDGDKTLKKELVEDTFEEEV